MFIQLIDGRLKDEASWARIQEMGQRWDREEAARAPGFLGGDWIRDLKDPKHIVAIIRFESAEKAAENSKRPETNKFFQEMLALSEGEPRFVDGDLVYSSGR